MSMREAEEQDTCRICSAPAEPDQPLFHPCKCSGTIRYIHQDCLTTWLAHSKKKNCDVCKHPYAFTKVYAADMPSRLPPVLLIRRLAQQCLFGILFVVRAIAVGIIWLGVLPWITVWTWRMYFSMGDSTAWWISDRPRPTSPDSSSFYNRIRHDPAIPLPKTLLGRLSTHPVWSAVTADIFTGQIIASVIVLTFVAVFLLREWISQNARPGVFEDDDVLPDEVPVPPAPPAPAPRVQNQNLPVVREDLLRRQQEAMRALQEMRAHRRPNAPQLAANQRFERPATKTKGKQREVRQPARARRRLLASDSENENQSELVPTRIGKRFKRQTIPLRPHGIRSGGARPNAMPGLAQPAPRSLIPPHTASPGGGFDFTFKVPTSLNNGTRDTRRSFSEPRSLQPPTSPPNRFQLQDTSGSSAVFRRSEEPSSSRPRLVYGDGLRRPPLPTNALPNSGPDSPFLVSPARTPLESPSLSTYRAPEELGLEAGPSRQPDYFGFRTQDAESEEETVHYDTDDELPSLTAHRLRKLQQELHSDSDSDSDFNPERDTPQYFADPEAERRGEPKLDTLDGSNSEGDTEAVEGSPPRLMTLTDSDDEEPPPRWLPEEDRQQENAGPPQDDEEEEEEVDEDMDIEEEEEDEDEVEDVEEVEEAPLEVRPVAQGAVQPPNNDPVVDQQAVDAELGEMLGLNEDLEGGVEDEMEGAMEAIGMRGPIYGVLQNAAIMIFVLDTAIGLGVWIPFTIGKSAALLSLDPHRFFQIIHLPIRAIRIITDPIVDNTAHVIVVLLLPRIFRVISYVMRFISFIGFFFVSSIFGIDAAEGISSTSADLVSRAASTVNSPVSDLFGWSVKDVPSSSSVVDAGNSTINIIESAFPTLVQTTEPYFAMLGKEVRLAWTKFAETWTKMALGQGPAERTFAVVLGYAVVSLLLALYLNILTVGNARTAGRAVRNAVRQQLLVVKVAAFIFIELVVFPLGCGIVLDLCTVWLFPEANLQSRIAFFVQAPLTAMFYHWVAGTMFMYSFAVLLSGCRTVMRPGAMWFIKDPQDQNSHPIRDILDRPTLTQLRKICVSGVMYSFVVACVVGSVAGLLILGNKSIMPFRWKNREPLSNVPVDLLFLHFVLPYTMRYFRPKKPIKQLATKIWKYLAATFRLTSYFFGGRHPEEEISWKIWSLDFLRSGLKPDAIKTMKDGSFRRVPNTDHLALPRDMRATASVNENGEPTDETAKELIAAQDAEAERARHNVRDDYCVVYIPPLFRYRIIAFITALWIIGATLLGVAVALPIQLGRSFFGLFTTREVHDGYSLILGFYLVWGCYLTMQAIDRLDKRRQRRSGSGPRGDLRILVFKRGLLWMAKISYMLISLGVVIPILVAFVMELYLVLPVRLVVDPGMTPRIRVVDAWALGLLYAKIGLHVNRLQRQNRINRGLQHITNNGWTRPDPVQATKEVIGPLIVGLVGMIVLPGAVFKTAQYLIPAINVDRKFIFMNVYPGIFLLAGLFRSGSFLYDYLSSWSQTVRDKEFLVEMRLRNHEPDKEEKEKTNGHTPAIETSGPAVPQILDREDRIEHH